MVLPGLQNGPVKYMRRQTGQFVNIVKMTLILQCIFPEAHILQAIQKKETESMMRIGCQGVGIEDVEAGKNFGAFTSVRTAKAMKVIGCTDVIIGHCEERKAKRQILEEAGVEDESAVTRVLNAEILRAQEAGLKVLYCIGESDKQRDSWRQVLSEQLMAGLNNTDLSEIIVAYETCLGNWTRKSTSGQGTDQGESIFY